MKEPKRTEMDEKSEKSTMEETIRGDLHFFLKKGIIIDYLKNKGTQDF